MYCQMFSVGLSSGDLGGRDIKVMFFGTSSALAVCQPARSRTRMAWAPAATWLAISSRWSCMAAVLQWGRTKRLWNGSPLLQQRYAGWATEGEEEFHADCDSRD